LSGRDLGSTVRAIRSAIARQLPLPEGVSLEYAGTFQTQQESFRGLLRVLVTAVLLVFVVLLFQFGSIQAPLAVLAIAIPALCGTVAALVVTRVAFNVSSFVGAILVVGIVAENAVFFLHVTERERAAGRSLHDALVAAAEARMRPILMTSFAAVCALLPLALGLGAGAAMQQPLAIAVIGGFTVSTLLLLFALPLLYSVVAR
jgi:multidrug efflux pump subunit AcrB